MKIMTCFAHPADTITNCGGTLARHADAGDEIVAVILTHGGRINRNSTPRSGAGRIRTTSSPPRASSRSPRTRSRNCGGPPR